MENQCDKHVDQREIINWSESFIIVWILKTLWNLLTKHTIKTEYFGVYFKETYKQSGNRS